MSLSVEYLDDLARVRITGSAMPGTHATVERSTDQIRWVPVRGGAPVEVVSSGFVLDDFEFESGVENYYRARPVVAETVNLGVSGTAATTSLQNIDGSFPNTYIGGRFLRLTLTIDDVDEVESLSFFLGRNDGFADYARWLFMAEFSGGSTFGRSGERFSIDLKAAEVFEVAGDVTLSPTGELEQLSAYDTARLRVVGKGNKTLTVQLHSVQLVDSEATQSYVSITFDDGHASVPELAKPKMDALGLFGTNYVVPETIDTPDRATTAQLDEMAVDGWEIAGHSFASAVHGSSYEGVTEDVAAGDLADLREWLSANYPDTSGHYSFAYPHGKYDATTDGASVEALVRRAGFRSGRTILSTTGNSVTMQIAGLPEVMPYRIHAASSISELSGGQLNPDNLTAPGGMLDKVTYNDGAWLVLVFHRIIDDSATPELLTNAEFDTDTTDWLAFSGATLSWSNGFAQIEAPGGVSVVEFGRPSATQVPVTEGSTYRIEASVGQASGTGRPGRLTFRWIDSGGSSISDDTSEAVTLSPVPQTISLQAEAPDGAVMVSPRFWYGDTGDMPDAGQIFYVSYFRMREVVLPSATSQITKSGFDKVMDGIASRQLKVRTVRNTLDEHFASITPAIEGPWVKSITRPYLNRPFKLYEFGEVERQARAGMFPVVGRSYPVAVSEVRGSRRQDISYLTDDDTERAELDYIIASGDALFLHFPPDCPVDSRYVSVGDTSEARTNYRHTKRRIFTLPTTEIAKPNPSIVGITSTWASVIDNNPTWASLVADHETWSDVADTIAGAEDVIVE